MRCFLLLTIGTLGVVVLAAPQGYEYKKPALVFEQNGFQAINTPRGILPCAHAPHHFNDAASAIIQSQSSGRIVNQQKQFSADHNLVTAASGFSPQSLLTTTAQGSINQDATQSFRADQGYVQNGHVPPQVQVPPFNTAIFGGGQHGASAHNQGYVYHQADSSHLQNNVNQYSHHHSYDLHSSSKDIVKPSLPVYPLPVSAFRPEQSYGNGNTIYTHGSSGFADSIGHGAHSSIQLESSAASHNVQHATGSSFNFGNSGFNTESLISSAGTADALNGQLGHVIRETFANAPLDPSVEKHIYVHVPPEDLEENGNQQSVVRHQSSAPPKKHYKIIFIKAPSAPTPHYSQLAAAVAPQIEEKTLVYVLVKKPEEPTLDQIQQYSYKSSKPEVYFIKYKARTENESSQYSTNPQNPTISTDASDLIDIRSGGESSSINTSTSFTSSSTESIGEGPKHELYGVPLN